jgi:putative lipoic acid-binding regulatory protein
VRPRRLRVLALAALLAAAAASPAPAGSLDEAGALVLRQIDALRRHDFATAYGFASRELRRNFSRGEFEWMLRRAHPEVADSTFASVVRTHESGGFVYVTVKVRGRNGESVEALYEMVHEADGWRVNALTSRPDDGLL